MSMELELALQRLLLPACFALIGCYCLARTDQGDDAFDDEPVRGVVFRTLFGAFMVGVGMIGADLWNRQILFKPDGWVTWKASYQWQWMVWIIPSGMVVIALLRSLFSTPIHYGSLAAVGVGLLAIGTMYVSLEEEVFAKEQSHMQFQWMAMSGVAIACNVLSLNSIASSGGGRWVSLVNLAHLGCIVAIAFQAYGSLGEWALTGVGASLGISLAGGIWGTTSKIHYGWQLSTVVLPLTIMAVTCVAVSRFFESAAIPWWLLHSILFLPAWVGAVDLVIGRLTHAWVRPVLAALICSLALGAIIYFAIPAKQEW